MLGSTANDTGHAHCSSEAKLEELKAGMGGARRGMLSTPHVMKSKREVFGQESAYLANALALTSRSGTRAQTLAGLRPAGEPGARGAGLPGGCGRIGRAIEGFTSFFRYAGDGVRWRAAALRPFVTPQTPVAKALPRKSVGDEFPLPTTPRTPRPYCCCGNAGARAMTLRRPPPAALKPMTSELARATPRIRSTQQIVTIPA